MVVPIEDDTKHELDSTILGTVEKAVEQILVTETLLINYLGISGIPLRVDENQAEGPTQQLGKAEFSFFAKHNQAEKLTTLVKDFTDGATTAVVALHKEIESVPPNRPFGGSVTIERLMVENANLMNEILAYDKNMAREFWSENKAEDTESN